MAHFALINAGRVQQVIVIGNDDAPDEATGQAFITGIGLPGQWIQTSYNTRGGVYYDAETGEPGDDQSKALRGNYAGPDFTYDEDLDAFIPPKPEPTGEVAEWVLDEATFSWVPLEA